MSEKIELPDEFPDTPEGWQRRWEVEFEGEEKEHRDFRADGEVVEDRYTETTALNLFFGDVETKKAMLYGNPPAVRTQRAFADPKDQPGRVGALMLERTLNAGVQRKKDPFRRALAKARDDRLLPGLGVMRFRYEVEWEDVPEVPAQMDEAGNELAPAVPATQRKKEEEVEPEHVNWRDFKWAPARCWDEVTWVGFRAEMTREDLHKRFDATVDEDPELARRLVDLIPLNAQERTRDQDRTEDPWKRAEVWEVWHKPSREVFWVVKGFTRILDRKPDPLGLEEFWPCPEPLFANVTSKKLIPKSDWAIHRPLYENVADIQRRRQDLIDALGVKGVFDAGSPEIEKLVKTKGNLLVSVPNMAPLTEKGGVQAAIQFFPIKDIVDGIAVLTVKLQEAIQLKDQAIGLADIMRGQATPGRSVTATERSIQAQSASTRQRSAQDEFAGFATDARNVQAEIISRWFDPETIVLRSNIANTNDAQHAQEAVALIKSDLDGFRIEVAADSLAQTNYDAVQQERMGALAALGGYFQQSMPFIQIAAGAGPQMTLAASKLVIANARWLLSGLRGAQALEAEFDAFAQAADEAAKAAMMSAQQPKPPDPKVQQAQIGLETAKVKGQVEMAKAKTDMQATVMDAQVKQAEHGMRMQELRAETVRDVAEAARPHPFQQMPGRLEEGR